MRYRLFSLAILLFVLFSIAKAGGKDFSGSSYRQVATTDTSAIAEARLLYVNAIKEMERIERHPPSPEKGATTMYFFKRWQMQRRTALSGSYNRFLQNVKNGADAGKELLVVKNEVNEILAQSKQGYSSRHGNKTKSYPADKNTSLIIENKFGDISIKTWDNDQLTIITDITRMSPPGKRKPPSKEITALVNERNALLRRPEWHKPEFDRLTKRLADLWEIDDPRSARPKEPEVTIASSKEGNLVSFKTIIKNVTEAGGEDSVRVNYLVYVPYNMAISLMNKYGDVTLSDFSGPLTLANAYGDVNAGTLRSTSSSISCDFCNVAIDDMKAGKLSVAHGKLILRNAGSVQAKLEYSPAKVQSVNGNSNFTLKFSNKFQIDRIGPQAKNLTIDGAYSDIQIGSAQPSAFNFSITTTGNLTYKKDKVNIKLPSRNTSVSASAVYSGRYGKPPPATKVIIRSKGGSVEII